jgi:hypothetical protein
VRIEALAVAEAERDLYRIKGVRTAILRNVLAQLGPLFESPSGLAAPAEQVIAATICFGRTNPSWAALSSFPRLAGRNIGMTFVTMAFHETARRREYRWTARKSLDPVVVWIGSDTTETSEAAGAPTGGSGLSGRASILIEAPSVAASKMVLRSSAKTLGGGHVVERYVCWLARLLGKSRVCE